MLILYVFVAKFIHTYSNAYIYIFLDYDKGIFAMAFETSDIA